jgi:hypothetical protein
MSIRRNESRKNGLRRSVHSAKCPFSEMSVRQNGFRENGFRENGFRENGFRENTASSRVLDRILDFGKMDFVEMTGYHSKLLFTKRQIQPFIK